MSAAEVIPMSPHGRIQWKRYRERTGFFMHAAELPSEEVVRVYDALSIGQAELLSSEGVTTDVLRYGRVALKRFRPWVYDPMLNGRLENLRMNVAMTYSLRDRPRIDQSRWRMRGPEYYGAYIADKGSEPTTWAMEYIQGCTPSEPLPTMPSCLASHLPNRVDTLMAAARSGGLTGNLFVDGHNGNYIVPSASIAAFQASKTELELVRIDVGSDE